MYPCTSYLLREATESVLYPASVRDKPFVSYFFVLVRHLHRWRTGTTTSAMPSPRRCGAAGGQPPLRPLPGPQLMQLCRGAAVEPLRFETYHWLR